MRILGSDTIAGDIFWAGLDKLDQQEYSGWWPGVDSAREQKKLAAILSPVPLSCAGSADRPGENACKPRRVSQQDNYIGDLVSHTLLLIGSPR
jgi:hypothetical protein